MIKTIENKERQFFEMIYCCGVITEYGIQLMNISKYKINLYKKMCMIEPVYENGKLGYKLTTKSKKFMSKKYGLKRSYTYRSIRHCSKLQEVYLNLDLKRYEWITESEALALINDKVDLSCKYNKKGIRYASISPVDAIVVDRETNVAYGIEIISPSYRVKQEGAIYKNIRHRGYIHRMLKIQNRIYGEMI